MSNDATSVESEHTMKDDDMEGYDRGKDGTFPWHIGVYDSHCHPTDSMHAIPELGSMNARVLTIMATRFQDQDLVAQVAEKYAYDDTANARGGSTATTVIPSFGYHPWFSHLIYDDLEQDPPQRKPEKSTHYNNVFTSSPVEQDLLMSLPEPTPLSKIIRETRQRLEDHPNALLGEVGLDRVFRIPHGTSWRSEDRGDTETRLDAHAASLTPGTHHSHPLTKHRVKAAHQIRIMHAQLRLAGELNRAASVHVVGGQGAAFHALRELWLGFEVKVPSAKERRIMWTKKKGDAMVVEEDDARDSNVDAIRPFPPRICLHSFSGPPETVQQYLHPSIPVEFYFSFSEAINFSTPEHQKRVDPDKEIEPAVSRALAAMKAVPDDRLLIESDLHICGSRMDELLKDILKRVCEARDWGLEDGMRILKKNWQRFVFGHQ